MARLMVFARGAQKFLAAATGAAAMAVSGGLISGTAQRWTTGLLGVATAFFVYLIPNRPPPPPDVVHV